jgi:hypothetical protein
MRTRSDRDSNWTSRWAKVGLTGMNPGLTYSWSDLHVILVWPGLAGKLEFWGFLSLFLSLKSFSHRITWALLLLVSNFSDASLLSVAKLNSNNYKKIWTTNWVFLQLRLDCHFDHAMLRVFITSTSWACPSWACDLCRRFQVTMNIWFDLPHWQTPLD